MIATRLVSSLRRDNTIYFRNNYHAIQIGMALLYVGIALFLIPKSFGAKPTLYIHDATGSGIVRQAVMRDQLDFESVGAVKLVASASAVRRSVDDNPGSLGVVSGSDNDAFLVAGDPNGLRGVATEVGQQLTALRTGTTHSATQRQVLDRDSHPISFRDRLVVFLLFADAGLVGFVFIGAVILTEKQDGVLRALRTSPLRTWEYLTSKALAFVWLALLFTAVYVPLTVGFGADVLATVLLVSLSSFASAVAGAAVAVHFRSFEQFVFPSLVVLSLLSLPPGVAYLVPSFSPGWLRILPTHDLIFGLHRAVYGQGSEGAVGRAVLTLVVCGAVAMLAAVASFNRKMARAAA